MEVRNEGLKFVLDLLGKSLPIFPQGNFMILKGTFRYLQLGKKTDLL